MAQPNSFLFFQALRGAWLPYPVTPSLVVKFVAQGIVGISTCVWGG